MFNILYLIQEQMESSGWDYIPLKTVFREGFNHKLQVELKCNKEDSTLSDLITLAVKIDHLVCYSQSSELIKIHVCDN